MFMLMQLLQFKINFYLYLQDVSGLNAFKEANKLLKQLNLGEIPSEILKESAFNGTCPPTIVDWCEPNRMRFVSCKDVSIQNYMDAHETAMKIKYKITTGLHSNNTYVLREAPRYSGKLKRNKIKMQQVLRLFI